MKNYKKIILSFSLVLFGILMSACNNDKTNKKGQTPIYQGMVLSDSSYDTLSFSQLNSFNHDDKDDHFYHNHHNHRIPDGGFAGDFENRNENLDKNNPFDDNSSTIEEKVNENLVITSDEDIYYTTLNQDIYVTIKLSNPDSYEILSFVLNGKKYSNYMFEEGSDLENLRLKVNVGNQAGIIDYTIDGIKYVDGTEIKDVIMDGETTVKAGVLTEDMVTTNVTNQNVTLKSISFDLVLNDGYSLIEKSNGMSKVLLYDGVTVVDTKDVVVGKNKIEFVNLEPNKLYQYAVVASYDDLTGGDVDKHILYKDVFYTNAFVMFTTPNITQTSVSWDYVWDISLENKTLIKQELYLDDTKIQDIELSDRTINDLFSNRKYTIKTTYKNLNNNEEIINLYFVTSAKKTPIINFEDVEITQSTFNFDIDVEDVDAVGSISKIELLYKGISTQLELNQRNIDDLLSNNDYTIKVTYIYDLNDGNGNQNLIKTFNFKTLSKVTPIIEVNNITSDKSSISFLIEETDVDDVGSLVKLELVDNNDTAMELELDQISVNDLLCDTKYTIKATYSYDLNDGNGVLTEIYEYEVWTLPSVEVTNFNVINTTSVSEGEIIYIQISLDNVSKKEITNVTINDKDYKVLPISTFEKLFIEITNDGQFVGGDTVLTISKLTYKYNDDEIVISVEENNQDSVFINGKLDVLSVELATKNEDEYEISDELFNYDDKYYAIIKLFNPTRYTIKSISFTLANESITYNVLASNIVDSETLVIPFTYNDINSLYIEIKSISYENEYVSKTDSFNGVSDLAIMVENQIVNVSTFEQLCTGMNYYYKLTNDIDMSGKTMNSGCAFVGVLDGNGYTIKNLSYIQESKSNIDLHLFSDVQGKIKNLKIKDVTIITNIVSDEAKSATVSLFGNVRGGIILDNVDVEMNISITGNLQDSIVGAYFASSEYEYDNAKTIILNCDNSSTISVSDHSVGGFIGYVGNRDLNINFINSLFSGFVEGIGRGIGGFIGLTNAISYFENSKVTGIINGGEYYIGGFIGEGNNISNFINCEMSGKIESTGEFVGGFIGNMTKPVSFKDCSFSGTITGNKPHIGGYIGYFSTQADFENCKSIGTIYGEKNYVGGFIGRISNDLTIVNFKDCESSSVVSSDGSMVGGFVGNLTSGTLTIDNCAVNGETGSIYKVGGFIGDIDSGTLAIVNSTVNGDITSEYDSAGGLVGEMSSGNFSFDNCIVNGDVSGSYRSGGLVGYISSGVFSFKNSTFAGSVVSEFDYIGGLVGCVSDSDINIENCEVTGSVTGKGNNVNQFIGNRDN